MISQDPEQMLQLVPKSMASLLLRKLCCHLAAASLQQKMRFLFDFLASQMECESSACEHRPLFFALKGAVVFRVQSGLPLHVLLTNVECAQYILDINDNTPIIHPTHPGHQQQYQRRHQWHQTRRQRHQWHQLNNVLVATLSQSTAAALTWNFEGRDPGKAEGYPAICRSFPLCWHEVTQDLSWQPNVWRPRHIAVFLLSICWLDDFPRSGRDGCYHPETGDSWRTVSPTLFAKESKEVDLRFMKRHFDIQQHWPIAVRSVPMVAIFEKKWNPGHEVCFSTRRVLWPGKTWKWRCRRASRWPKWRREVWHNNQIQKMPLPPEWVHACFQANQYMPWIHVKLALHCTDLLTEPSKPIKIW